MRISVREWIYLWQPRLSSSTPIAGDNIKSIRYASLMMFWNGRQPFFAFVLDFFISRERGGLDKWFDFLCLSRRRKLCLLYFRVLRVPFKQNKWKEDYHWDHHKSSSSLASSLPFLIQILGGKTQQKTILDDPRQKNRPALSCSRSRPK